MHRTLLLLALLMPLYTSAQADPQPLTTADLEIYPIPARDQLIVAFEQPQDGSLTVGVRAMDGRLIQFLDFGQKMAGPQRVGLQLPTTMLDGSYILELNSGRQVLRVKFVMAGGGS
ncbi:MAG: hypothetical protein ABI432_16865 [Flavobacteriales bacterium]